MLYFYTYIILILYYSTLASKFYSSINTTDRTDVQVFCQQALFQNVERRFASFCALGTRRKERVP